MLIGLKGLLGVFIEMGIYVMAIILLMEREMDFVFFLMVILIRYGRDGTMKTCERETG